MNNDQSWTTVQTRPKAKKFAPENCRRLILVRTTHPDFSSLTLRNAFNKAFLEKGVQGPVVNTITKSLTQNLVITTSEHFTADYLLEKQAIWQHLISFKSAHKDVPWHKVVIHGVPTLDFNTPEGMKLVTEEIKTFNKGLHPMGTPYWLTSPEKRATQRVGSVVVAFATPEEADRAVRHRLYIAGISARVEKLYKVAPTTQCSQCQGFGHLNKICRRDPSCRLCGEKHATQQHSCNSCQVKGVGCRHLTPKCVNCKGTHTSDSKTCEILLAIKSSNNSTTPI
jgi:hypothetical protein